MTTNEEQAAILSGRVLGLRDGATKEKFDIAMKMARWKDEQFAAEKQALIDKACEQYRVVVSFSTGRMVDELDTLVENFKKILEETK